MRCLGEGEKLESWDQEALPGLKAYAKLTYKLYILPYILLTGGNAQGQQRAKSDNVGRESMGYLRHSSLGLTATAQGKEQGRHTLVSTLQGPGSSLRQKLVKSTLGQGHLTDSPSVLSSGSLRKPWIGSPLNNGPMVLQAIAKWQNILMQHFCFFKCIQQTPLPMCEIIFIQGYLLSQNCKQPNCPSTGGLLNELWYNRIREICSVRSPSRIDM